MFFGNTLLAILHLEIEKKVSLPAALNNLTRPYSVANWGGGMSVCCTAGPIVRYRGQWMAA